MTDATRAPRAEPPASLLIPRPERPDIPEYGVPRHRRGLLGWAWVSERMATATTYWIATTRPDGRPHAMPTWGAWMEERLWFEGGLRTRRARNLAARPACVASVQRGDDVIIIEGAAVRTGEPDHDLTERLLSGYTKYEATHGYRADPGNWRVGGLWYIEPRVVFAWSRFPTDCTRWTFATRGG